MASPLEELRRPRPTVTTLSVALWVMSCVAGLVVLAHFASDLGDVRAELRETVRRRDPDLSRASLRSVVDTTLTVAFAGLALPIVVTFLLALRMSGQRSGARILLALVGVLAVPLGAVALGLLVDDASEIPWFVWAAVTAQEACVLGGLVTMFLPASNAWFRQRAALPRRR